MSMDSRSEAEAGDAAGGGGADGGAAAAAAPTAAPGVDRGSAHLRRRLAVSLRPLHTQRTTVPVHAVHGLDRFLSRRPLRVLDVAKRLGHTVAQTHTYKHAKE